MSDSQNDDQLRQTPRPWQPRFGIGTLMLLMLIVCVVGTAASHYVRATHGGRSAQLVFILFTLAAPLLLVVIVSLLQALFRRR